MSSHNKKECPGKKPCEPQTRTRLESMPLSRPLIKSSSRQCVIRVPADSRTPPAPNDSPSKTTSRCDIKYCTSDTCRNSSSCIKTLPKYCPYGIKKQSDTSVCPGACSQPDDGNESDVVDYRHSMISLAESIAKSLQNLTSECPAKISPVPRSSLSRAALCSADNERDVRKDCFHTSGSRESMHIPSPENSVHDSESELSPRKVTCCPDVDSDTDNTAGGKTSQENICPSVKAYLDKQTSTHETNKQNVTTQKSVSRTTPTVPALNRSTSSKGGVKPTKSPQAAVLEELKSSKSTCPAVESAYKILSELPCSAQAGQVNHHEDLEKQTSSSQRKSSCCTNNQQKFTGRDTEQQYCKNAGRISLVTRRSQLPEETDSKQCCPSNEPKNIDMMRPCAEESFPCCKSAISKSATALSQEKLAKLGSSCNKPSCSMTMCAPRSNVKCASDNELPKSSTNLTSPLPKNADKSKDLKPQSVGVSSNNCTSALCPGNETKAQCDCRYPPAFRQFGCTGNIAGNCDCASKNI
ncbi:hypothetical protein K1T71_014512 [Dendrolimus kikuchii]|uniref:Uncharacterized protein n=1 Tax=Dendrolimus kikuchii TaxID=765133 RepID=A0ACC1CEA7_9NEOP|nr:hypothetical protein K1T71_014512 [Dendrolimus kikuchii]